MQTSSADPNRLRYRPQGAVTAQTRHDSPSIPSSHRTVMVAGKKMFDTGVRRAQLFFEVTTIAAEISCSTFLLPQCSHAGFGFSSCSEIVMTTKNFFPQSLQMYSYVGMGGLRHNFVWMVRLEKLRLHNLHRVDERLICSQSSLPNARH